MCVNVARVGDCMRLPLYVASLRFILHACVDVMCFLSMFWVCLFVVVCLFVE